MGLNPFRELLSRDLAGREVEHQAFLFVDRCLELESIQDQKRFNRGVAYPLIAVDERVVERQGKTQRRRFGVQRRVQIASIEGGTGLRESRFQGSEFSNAGRTARAFENGPVKCDDFPER